MGININQNNAPTTTPASVKNMEALQCPLIYS
jgi:hypothetical protein